MDPNPVVDVILRRHSVREGFGPKPVPVEILEDILRCGLAAPSSKNAQPWRFHVVSDRRLLDELAGMMESAEGVETYVPSDPATGLPRREWRSTVLESAAILRNVPIAIFVENTGVFSRGRHALVKATREALAQSIVGYTFEAVGVGAAVQNMWIAAVAHGLSGVFMGDVLIAEREIQQRLGIANDLVGALGLGYLETCRECPARGDGELRSERVRWVSQS